MGCFGLLAPQKGQNRRRATRIVDDDEGVGHRIRSLLEKAIHRQVTGEEARKSAVTTRIKVTDFVCFFLIIIIHLFIFLLGGGREEKASQCVAIGRWDSLCLNALYPDPVRFFLFSILC